MWLIVFVRKKSVDDAYSDPMINETKWFLEYKLSYNDARFIWNKTNAVTKQRDRR